MVGLKEEIKAATTGSKSSLMRVENAGWIQLPSFSAEDGSTLSFAEANAHIPFDIKRFYYIYNFDRPGIQRGGHAHKFLEQVFFCLSGRFVFRLDDGMNKQDVVMDQRGKGMFVGPRLWHDMADIDSGTVILAVASDRYNEDDYIRDYQQFLKYVEG